MALTLNVSEIAYGAVMRREPDVREIKFDNGGYSLRMRRGMNTDRQVWDIPLNVITIGGANIIENFLVFHGGVDWFWWVPPRQTSPRKFICKRWTREPLSGSKTHDKMTMVFEEVFDLSG